MKKYLLKYTLEFLVIVLGIALFWFYSYWQESNKNEHKQ